ncbi:hypothetical protein HN446_02650 [bacterium]|nr:hypothetical protein [bacterium]
MRKYIPILLFLAFFCRASGKSSVEVKKMASEIKRLTEAVILSEEASVGNLGEQRLKSYASSKKRVLASIDKVKLENLYEAIAREFLYYQKKYSDEIKQEKKTIIPKLNVIDKQIEENLSHFKKLCNDSEHIDNSEHKNKYTNKLDILIKQRKDILYSIQKKLESVEGNQPKELESLESAKNNALNELRNDQKHNIVKIQSVAQTSELIFANAKSAETTYQEHDLYAALSKLRNSIRFYLEHFVPIRSNADLPVSKNLINLGMYIDPPRSWENMFSFSEYLRKSNHESIKKSTTH